MKRTQIDFAAPSLRRTLHHTPASAAGLVCLALLWSFLAANTGWHYLEMRRSHAAQLAAARARTGILAPVPVAVRQPTVSVAEAAAINAAVMQLNLPWRALQDALDSATPSSVALLEIAPDANKRTLRISAEARGSDDMIDYVARLKREEMFADVALRHHEINERDPNRPIRFELDATWSVP